MARIVKFPSKTVHQASFEKLVRPHVKSLYKLAYRFTRNAMDAEDLVQELLIKFYPRIDELAKVEKLRPWLVRAMYRLWIDGLRKHHRSPISLIEDGKFSESEMEFESIQRAREQEIEHSYTQQQLQRAIDQLAEHHRIVLVLYDVEGYTLEEMATTLNCPVGTLKSRLHRARAQLKKLLIDGTF